MKQINCKSLSLNRNCKQIKKKIQKTKANNTHHPYINFCQADSDDSDGSITSHQQSIKTVGGHSGTPATAAKKSTPARAASTDSTTSTESSASSTPVRSSAAATTAAKQTTKPEVPAAMQRHRGSTELAAEKKPFQSRFLPSHPAQAADKKDETETSSEEETTTEESEEEEEEEEVQVVSKKPATATGREAATKTDIGPLLNRSNQAREAYADTRRSRDDTSSRGGYSSPTYGRSVDDSRYTTTPTVRSRANQQPAEDDHSSRYGTGSSG